MKRFLLVLILLALVVVPAFAQDDECPGVRCPEEQPSPGCAATMAALVLLMVALKVVRK